MMIRTLFLLEWLARFFHLGMGIRIQSLMRQRVKQATKKSSASVFVHMCAYNGVEVIESAVNSMLAQSHQNWHLFISDDASTDETWGLIEQISDYDDRIQVERLPNNLYQSGKSHRNIGLSRFKEGMWDYYAILDQDDVAERDWLARCLGLDWNGVSVLRMWNARYDWSLEHHKYEYPTAAQIMVPRTELIGIEYRRGSGLPVDTDFLYRMEFRAVKKFKAVVVAPFLCQRMRFSETNQTANPETVSITRWAFFRKYFWNA